MKLQKKDSQLTNIQEFDMIVPNSLTIGQFEIENAANEC